MDPETIGAAAERMGVLVGFQDYGPDGRHVYFNDAKAIVDAALYDHAETHGEVCGYKYPNAEYYCAAPLLNHMRDRGDHDFVASVVVPLGGDTERSNDD